MCVCLCVVVVFIVVVVFQAGWGCSSVGKASDRHAAETGSIPRCAKGFFSQSTFSADSLYDVRAPPCVTACIKIYAHVKDPVVHVRVRWIMEALKRPACTVGWVARLCRCWLSHEKAPEFPMGEIPMKQYSCCLLLLLLLDKKN